MDNGWLSYIFSFRRAIWYWATLSTELDGDAASEKTNSGTGYSSTTSMNVVDSHSIAWFGEAGSLTFAGHGGIWFLKSNDDVMPTASEEPWDVVSGADAGIINAFWNS